MSYTEKAMRYWFKQKEKTQKENSKILPLRAKYKCGKQLQKIVKLF